MENNNFTNAKINIFAKKRRTELFIHVKPIKARNIAFTQGESAKNNNSTNAKINILV